MHSEAFAYYLEYKSPYYVTQDIPCKKGFTKIKVSEFTKVKVSDSTLMCVDSRRVRGEKVNREKLKEFYFTDKNSDCLEGFAKGRILNQKLLCAPLSLDLYETEPGFGCASGFMEGVLHRDRKTKNMFLICLKKEGYLNGDLYRGDFYFTQAKNQCLGGFIKKPHLKSQNFSKCLRFENNIERYDYWTERKQCNLGYIEVDLSDGYLKCLSLTHLKRAFYSNYAQKFECAEGFMLQGQARCYRGINHSRYQDYVAQPKDGCAEGYVKGAYLVEKKPEYLECLSVIHIDLNQPSSYWTEKNHKCSEDYVKKSTKVSPTTDYLRWTCERK